MRTSRGMCISVACAILVLEVGCASSGSVNKDADGGDTSGDTDSHWGDDADTEAMPPLDTEGIVDKVDTFWGSAPPQATRLRAFDDMWWHITLNYAGFAVSDVNWDLVYERDRPKMNSALSYGRFYQVFSQIFNELHDGHTATTNTLMCGEGDSPLDPPPNPRLSERPPLYIQENRISFIGACAATLEDDTLLVYRATPDNPAGLSPGDVILGYDKRTWRALLEIIDDMTLPSCGRSATQKAAVHIQRMESVVNNFHLFGQMDVRKADSGAIVSISTDKLIASRANLLCNDQLPLPELDFPCDYWEECYDGFPKLHGLVNWTILPSKIGYIYVYGWLGTDTDEVFREAINEMFDTTIGLVIDQRFGMGGGPAWREGMSILFDKSYDTLHEWFLVSEEGSIYPALVDKGPSKLGEISGDSASFYDHPIAILTGSKMGSAGDVFPYLMTYHPRARRFGRLTDGRVGNIELSRMNQACPEMFTTVTRTLFSDPDGNFLQKNPLHPEERVWFKPDDVTAGVDTVRQAAFDWIESNQ